MEIYIIFFISFQISFHKCPSTNIKVCYEKIGCRFCSLQLLLIHTTSKKKFYLFNHAFLTAYSIEAKRIVSYSNEWTNRKVQLNWLHLKLLSFRSILKCQIQSWLNIVRSWMIQLLVAWWMILSIYGGVQSLRLVCANHSVSTMHQLLTNKRAIIDRLIRIEQLM